jgi:ubiquinone/menaquinone biosynthesis C-methylase UbiE
MSPRMTQNIYDNDEFFAGYSKLARSVDGLAGAPEWPALRALLPPMRGLRVLDLGCGFGWFCRWAAEEGAGHVLGIDVSEKMLERARAGTPQAAVAYARGDLEQLDIAAAAYDLVYSSLALHYIAGLDALIAGAHRGLVPGGRLVVSVEYPIYTAPSAPRFVTDAQGGKTWPVDGYLREGARRTNWLTKGVIKQHRTIGTYVSMLLRLGFTLTHLEEWGPSEAAIAARPAWAGERDRPPFLLLAAHR